MNRHFYRHLLEGVNGVSCAKMQTRATARHYTNSTPSKGVGKCGKGRPLPKESEGMPESASGCLRPWPFGLYPCLRGTFSSRSILLRWCLAHTCKPSVHAMPKPLMRRIKLYIRPRRRQLGSNGKQKSAAVLQLPVIQLIEKWGNLPDLKKQSERINHIS